MKATAAKAVFRCGHHLQRVMLAAVLALLAGEARAQQHPRLYLDAALTSELPARARRPEYQWITTRLIAHAEANLNAGPPPYVATEDPEQLWMRPAGNAIPNLTMAWLLTGDGRFLRSALAYARTALTYPEWGRRGEDLSASHLLFGIALLYDWAFDALSPAERTELVDGIVMRGETLHRSMFDGRGGNRAYLQNHLWIRAAALTGAALALEPERPEFRRWTEVARAAYARTTELLGPDGASHEGVGYWEYGTEWMLKYGVLARRFLEQDIFVNPWWRETAYYRLYLTTPRNGWRRGRFFVTNTVVDMADSQRGVWYGPDPQLVLLAAMYRNPYAMGLARSLAEAGAADARSAWATLLWQDPAVPAATLNTLPTLRHFADMGLVSTRSDWSGDETLLVHRCGPTMGHKVQAMHIDVNSAGHVHPDVGGFSLFGGGDWVIRNAGYLQRKDSIYENALRIAGVGQLGAGGVGMDGRTTLNVNPRLEVLQSVPAIDHLRCDATSAYAPASGLRHWQRDLIFLKRAQVLLVVDDIALEREALLQIDFHPEQHPVAGADGVRAGSGLAALWLGSLSGARLTTAMVPVPDGGRPGPPVPTVTAERHAADWHHVMVLAWGPSAGPVTPDRLRQALCEAGASPQAMEAVLGAGRTCQHAAGRAGEK